MPHKTSGAGKVIGLEMSDENKKKDPIHTETFFLPPLKMVLAFFDKKKKREKKKKDTQTQEKPTEKDVEKLIEKLSEKDE